MSTPLDRNIAARQVHESEQLRKIIREQLEEIEALRGTLDAMRIPFAKLDPVYATTGTQSEAVLRCIQCRGWEADADGASILDVTKRAADHVREHGKKETP